MMTSSQHHFCSTWRQRRVRVTSVHVLMAAITVAFMGGVALGMNGWLLPQQQQQRVLKLRAARASGALPVQESDNVSSSSSSSSDQRRNGMVDDRRRRTTTMDLTLPMAIISHNRQEVVRGDGDGDGGAITLQRPVAAVAVTAGLPQITRQRRRLLRPYPLQGEWRSHDGRRRRRRPATTIHDPRRHPDRENVTANKDGGGGYALDASLIENGVLWSEALEAQLPRGFDDEDVAAWTSFSSNATVVKVLDGCGRMQNRMLVFENGSRSCCRYRQNNDQIQGEIFSFYLARLLGLRNLPPASLGLLYGREWQWSSVRGQLTLAQWSEQKPVVMTQFVDGLEPAFIPRQFRGDDRRLHPIADDLAAADAAELLELLQWSDLIVFDYLTANLDRVVNNMYNRQWNPDMMLAPAHNLAKEVRTGLLVFLDNESGLLHGYRLLDKYESYHKSMLQSLCVFRARTVRAVRTLLAGGDVGHRLRTTLHESQPYMTDWLPPLPDKSVKILRKRLEAVDRQVTLCERRYNAPTVGSSSDDGGTVERYDSPVTPLTS